MNFVNDGVIGADVSYWQDINTTPQQINFSKMVEQGAMFTIIRAGQNLWPDPDFDYNWRNARTVGLERGTYFLYDSRVSPEQQATLFANQVIGDMPELEMWADLEENYKGPYQGYANWKKFLVALRNLLPTAKIGIYTSYGYINGKIPQSEYEFFAQFPLWLAWWTEKDGKPFPVPSQPVVPAPWKSAKYWQWGTPAWGLAWGCESLEIDQNIFNGTKEDFYTSYNITTGETMDENFKYLADKIYAGLHEIAESVKMVDTGGGGVTPPPVDDGRTRYIIKENDPNMNDMVKIYKSPDSNETNLELVWAKNGANSCTVYDKWEDVPGHPVWNSYTSIQKENTYKVWKAIDCTITDKMYNANGKAYAFPAKIRYADGSTPKVVWIRKEDLGL